MIHDNYVAFKAVADCRSFSKAAKQLHISQPAISVKVQTLEEYYGTKLFDRVKYANLTETGRVLYDYVDKCLELHDTVLNTISETTGVIRGNLHLGATLTIGEYILPRLIGYFIKEYPEVRCNMEIANTEKIVEKLLADEIDLGLIEGPISHPQLIKESFLKDELVLVIPSNHRWANKEFIKPKDILQEKYILRELGSGTRSVFEEKLRERGMDDQIEVAMELGSTQAIKEAVLAGLGVAVISACTIQRELQMGLLKTLRVNGMALQRDLNIYYYKHRFRTKAAESFLQMLKTSYGSCDLNLPLEINEKL